MSEGQKTAILWLIVAALLVVMLWFVTLLAPPPFSPSVHDGIEPPSVQETVGEYLAHFGKTDINAAVADELLELPYMTEELARRIGMERDRRLPRGFSSLSELLSVEGVTPSMLEAWAELLYCG